MLRVTTCRDGVQRRLNGHWQLHSGKGYGPTIIKQLCLIGAHNSFQMLLEVIPDVFFRTSDCWEHPCTERARATSPSRTACGITVLLLRTWVTAMRSAAFRSTPKSQSLLHVPPVTLSFQGLTDVHSCALNQDTKASLCILPVKPFPSLCTTTLRVFPQWNLGMGGAQTQRNLSDHLLWVCRARNFAWLLSWLAWYLPLLFPGCLALSIQLQLLVPPVEYCITRSVSFPRFGITPPLPLPPRDGV